ncbi:MAG: biopolymer transporter ExbD [Gammaproteobacteria bacterium]|nr:biopolymer transporter ExbD [Gammaproteobacteria bacterium]
MIIGSQSNPDRPRGDHGLVPLINVVFLLLAFFMIAGQIQRSDVIRVAPPVSISETVPAEQRLELVVVADGTIYLEGEAVLLGELASAFRRRMQMGSAPPGSGSSDPDGRVVLVKADADLEVMRLEAVLEELVRAGASRAALATTLNHR